MNSPRRRKSAPHQLKQSSAEPPENMPEWLELVRLRVEHEAPPVWRALMIRSIKGVMGFLALSEESAINAAAAPTDMAALFRAVSSGELLDHLKSIEPLAPALFRGAEARRRLLDEHGGTLTSDEVASILEITRQAVEKRRRAGSLLALSTGRHGYRYPVWQFDKSGVVPGLGDVLRALASHDEWMQAAFFLGKNPRLNDQTPIDLLKAGKLKRVLDAAEVYGEHGAA